MELLTEILLMALNDTRWSTEDLQRLASVCKYWREVILKMPQFWRIIDLHHGKGVWTQVLSRNPAGPLDVRISGFNGGFYWVDAGRFRDLFDLLKSESKRIRSIDSNVPLHSAYLQTFLNGAAFPLLSDIKIAISPPPWTPYLFNVEDGVPFQNLQLSGVVIPWDSPRLRGLETMSIWGVQSNAPSFSELHRALSSSPRLRRLCLFNWTIYINRSIPLPKDTKLPKINLPHLSFLAISSVSDPINSHLLSILEAPMLKNIRWLSVHGLDSGSILLRLSKGCIRMSQELVIHWTEWSRRLIIKSEPWSDSPSSKPSLSEVGKTVDIGIDGIQDPLHLVSIAAEFLGPSNKVLFTTSSETVLTPVADILQSSGAKFVVRLSSLTR